MSLKFQFAILSARFSVLEYTLQALHHVWCIADRSGNATIIRWVQGLASTLWAKHTVMFYQLEWAAEEIAELEIDMDE